MQMSNIIKYKNIVLKYIKESNIHSLQEISNRVVITISQSEDCELRQKIKQEIEALDSQKK